MWNDEEKRGGGCGMMREKKRRRMWNDEEKRGGGCGMMRKKEEGDVE